MYEPENQTSFVGNPDAAHVNTGLLPNEPTTQTCNVCGESKNIRHFSYNPAWKRRDFTCQSCRVKMMNLSRKEAATQRKVDKEEKRKAIAKMKHEQYMRNRARILVHQANHRRKKKGLRPLPLPPKGISALPSELKRRRGRKPRDLGFPSAPLTVTTEQIPVVEKQKDPANIGWVCPLCGKGVAPWITSCNCQ